MCGRFRRWLYGMMPAAGAWDDDYSGKLSSIGFRKGVAAPTALFRPEGEVRCVVHGDDFTLSGEREDLLKVAHEMEKDYERHPRGRAGG